MNRDSIFWDCNFGNCWGKPNNTPIFMIFARILPKSSVPLSVANENNLKINDLPLSFSLTAVLPNAPPPFPDNRCVPVVIIPALSRILLTHSVKSQF